MRRSKRTQHRTKRPQHRPKRTFEGQKEQYEVIQDKRALRAFFPELAWSLAWNTRVWLNRKVMISPIPNCGAKYLVRLSNHLTDVHGLDYINRRKMSGQDRATLLFPLY